MFIFYHVCGYENGSRVVIRNKCDDSHIGLSRFHIYGISFANLRFCLRFSNIFRTLLYLRFKMLVFYLK